MNVKQADERGLGGFPHSLFVQETAQVLAVCRGLKLWEIVYRLYQSRLDKSLYGNPSVYRWEVQMIAIAFPASQPVVQAL